ncbi:phenylpropionate dioxygenase-like ring-hydroxylating dioxygenase large terminal subunit [Tumebacillus sp. BK434]|uniref:aromatic ring-hydroxylating oxygenase subunit alpha n=1 Tax=Tumebacillus sp. BK434 TaxID=2512169 RepID=UPI00104FE3B9|nr:aromatic ring-hydroxylating dioxygenase subunit alpha [Tumebacillus sp. BK434]TCP48442.1 phenylpropionate dioxygenase-like ring-hydroxylating dioxygenase large terminal subunit [Tumebacillus sp. BK434]
MRNEWYVACRSDELVGDMLECSILSTELILYRDSAGVAHALHNQCPHRGARLSQGELQGDCVVCPFHGWTFDGSGTCKLIPANGPHAPIPKQAKATSFPVQEAGGYVWVFVGDAEVKALQVPTELTDPDWRAVPFLAEWDAHLTRVVESVLDVSHLPFVHPESTGTDVNPMVEGPEFRVTGQEIVIVAKPYHPLVRTPLNEEEAGGSTITFTWPNQLILRTDMFQGNQMATYLALTPLTDERIRIHGLALRNFIPDAEAIDEIHYEHNVTVLEQDRPVVEGLRPKQSPLALKEEVHVRSDAPQVRYRNMYRNALEKEQWGGEGHEG